MKKFILSFLIAHFAFLISQLSMGQIIHVPADQPTIQAGINAAGDGDTVLVADGTYLENINFNGKAISVASHFIMDADTNHINNTVIDGSQPANPDNGSVVTFITGEDTTSVLCGFTITGGSGFYIDAFDMRLGGGVVCYYTGVKLLNNKITGNEVSYSGFAGGGGVACYAEVTDNWLVAKDNRIFGNTCTASSDAAFAGGVYAASNLIFNNNEVYGNQCSGNNTAEANGTGILFEQTSGISYSFNIQDNQFYNNNGNGYNSVGGGVWIIGGEGSITGNTFNENSVTGQEQARGGGLFLSSTTGITIVADNYFFSNAAEGYDPTGGALYILQAEDIVFIHNNVFEQNTVTATYAAWGGAIAFLACDSMSVNNNLILDNTVEGVDFVCGAGIYGQSESGSRGAEFRNNHLLSNSGNAETGYGGGIGFYSGILKHLEIDGNIFENNSMPTGGGLWTYECFDAIISNNIFTGNTASSYGGACRLREYPGNQNKETSTDIRIRTDGQEPFKNNRSDDYYPLMINNTYYNNNATSGGAIYCDHIAGIPIIVNSIFWDNHANTADNIYSTGPDSLLISHCDINDSINTHIYGKWKGTANFYADPVFCDTLCNIQGSSPCVDVGIDSFEFAGTWYYAPDHDFAGSLRPFFDGIDIGAYEYDNTGFPELRTQNSKLKTLVYPNPTSGISHFSFHISQYQYVSLKIYDLHGREVSTVLEQEMPAGEHSVQFDVSGLPGGIYFLRVQAGEEEEAGKIVVLR